MDEKKFDERLEQIIKDAEEKINKACDKFDDKFVEEKLKNLRDELEKKIDEKFSGRQSHKNSRRSGEFWGFILVVIGLVFLAENLRWIDWDLPFWPTALIVVGAFMIFQSSYRD